jgi:uncharacterized protein YxjI
MKPRLFVEQKITAFVNRYAVYEAGSDEKKGKMIAFAQQKRFALKERVDFYIDDSKKQHVFTLRAEKVLDVHGKYFVEDERGKAVGVFRKEFARSLFNSTWNILDKNDQTQVKISESNTFLAIARRFAGMLPYVGELLELATKFFRYHFVFRTADGKDVGIYIKTTLFRDHYRLDMTDEAYALQDWRTYAAFAVALDALQSR